MIILSHFLKIRCALGNKKINICSEFDSSKGCLCPRACKTVVFKTLFYLLLVKVAVRTSAAVIIVHQSNI